MLDNDLRSGRCRVPCPRASHRHRVGAEPGADVVCDGEGHPGAISSQEASATAPLWSGYRDGRSSLTRECATVQESLDGMSSSESQSDIIVHVAAGA